MTDSNKIGRYLMQKANAASVEQIKKAPSSAVTLRSIDFPYHKYFEALLATSLHPLSSSQPASQSLDWQRPPRRLTLVSFLLRQNLLFLPLVTLRGDALDFWEFGENSLTLCTELNYSLVKINHKEALKTFEEDRVNFRFLPTRLKKIALQNILTFDCSIRSH